MVTDATRAAKVAPKAGDILAGKYEVEEVVGSGGMGVVVSARHLELRQTVAIKLLLADESTRAEASQRFLREARAVAALRSDHVVRIYDLGTLADGVPFMVMELLRGRDLGRLLDERGPLPIEHAVEYVLQACDAVAEAHAVGIVHRDLKPSNLFVTRRSDGGPLVKVLDFGISKAFAGDHVQGDLTGTQAILGSPFYMSPEQVRDSRNVDPRADIWALGVILHELLSGTPVFAADTFPGVCAAIIADPPTPLSRLRPDVPPELEAIVLKCLEKDPRARFATVADLMHALRHFAPRRGSLSTIPVPAPTSLPTSADFARVSSDAPTISSDELPGGMPQLLPSTSRSRELVQTHGPVAKSEPQLQLSLPAAARKNVVGWVIGAVTGAIVLALVIVLTRHASSGPAPAASTRAEPAANGFELRIESNPPGADVYEGEAKLGSTPLTLTIDSPSVSAGPRTFTLRRDGYAPYALVQGRSSENVRVLANLLELPAQATPNPSASSAEPAVKPSRRPRRSAAPAAAKQPAETRGPSTPSDIRLER